MKLPAWLGPAAAALAVVCAALWLRERIESAEARGRADAYAVEVEAEKARGEELVDAVVQAHHAAARQRAHTDSLQAAHDDSLAARDARARREQAAARERADRARAAQGEAAARAIEAVPPNQPEIRAAVAEAVGDLTAAAETERQAAAARLLSVEAQRDELRGMLALERATWAREREALTDERDALRALVGSRDETIRLLEAEVGALRGASGSPGWLGIVKLAGCAAGGAVVGSWIADDQGAAIGAAAGVVGCRIL